METEVDGSGYQIAYITRLSSENEKKEKKFRLVTDQVVWFYGLTPPPNRILTDFSVSVALVNYTRQGFSKYHFELFLNFVKKKT